MRFELTPEIVDQVIFAMENQETPFLFDSENRTVVDNASAERSGGSEEEGESGVGRFVDIPVWSSADGFQLMERFVATLRNPLVREKLREALGGGKGVFRNFKNTLKEHGEVERLWFAFKDREMRAKVVEWYNDLCDLWGWERLSREPDEEEETEELVLSDFEFQEEGSRGVDLVRMYDREAWEEALASLPAPILASLFRRARVGVDPAADSSIIVSARTPSGEFAGFVWGVENVDSAAEAAAAAEPAEPARLAWLRIVQLYVTREFRGLGIAKTLIDRLCRVAYSHGIQKIIIDLAGGGEVLAGPLEAEGFSAISHTLLLDVDKWGRENVDQ